jgi:hypothetical protein
MAGSMALFVVLLVYYEHEADAVAWVKGSPSLVCQCLHPLRLGA